VDRYDTPEFKPYVNALGQFSLAWNALQHNLCVLFSIVTLERTPVAGDEFNDVPTHIWHAIKSDRSQREMLCEAIKHSKLGKENQLAEHGKWLIDRVGELENRRNDILHSALIPIERSPGVKEVIPDVFFLNPKARNLQKTRNLLEEILSCCSNAILLADYAQMLTGVLLMLPRAQFSWPDRPLLQGRHPKETPVSQNPISNK
jgi:hypothetical protein